MAALDRAARGGRSGNTLIEFALVFLLLLTIVVAMFEFSWVLFLKATFHHAVREGVRQAITGDPGGAGIDAAVKAAIKENTFGLMSQADLDAHVSVEFFDPNCPNGLTCPAGGAASAGVAPAESGSVVQVAIRCYDVIPITNLISRNPTTGAASPFTLNVSTSDKMEPFPGVAPNRGTLASPTACN